jgi:hypothetical protein
VYKAPYVSVENIGRVFVYLMKGKDPICFYKASVEEFLDPNPKFRWVELTNDLSVGTVKDAHKAGLLSFKLSIRERKKDENFLFEKFPAWSKQPPKRLNPYKARVYIYQCRDLPSADDDGQSDPYIKVWTLEGSKRTSCIEDNNNPIFFESVEIPVIDAASLDELPPFVLDLYDKDSLGDDFIGRSIITRADASLTEDGAVVPDPRWHPVRVKQGAPP